MKRLLTELFGRSWWVIAFILVCTILFENGMKKREAQYSLLSEQLAYIDAERELALHTKEQLEMQINSQSDPAWIELVLMEKLGMVPEGYKKVFFYEGQEKEGND